ncbi:MAG: ArsR family transcriptional regulator [bacterium]
MSGKLSPTLWRTCRVLANRKRLAILCELFRNPGLTVTMIASRLNLQVPVTSRYTRELNARGLLQARRSGKWVRYRPFADKSVQGAVPLLRELAHAFAVEKQPIELIYRKTTAFTHPRRIAIVIALRSGCHTIPSLRSRTGISRFALARHLKKLEQRGFVWTDTNGCRILKPTNRFASELLELATQE